LTLAVGVGTAWLVVHAATEQGRLERVLGPVLLGLLGLCLLWFFFDPLLVRSWRRLAGFPDPHPSVSRTRDGVRLGLHRLRSVANVQCEVISPTGVTSSNGKNGANMTEVFFDFPAEFQPPPDDEGGKWRVRWLVLPMFHAHANVEVARDSFFWNSPIRDFLYRVFTQWHD